MVIRKSSKPNKIMAEAKKEFIFAKGKRRESVARVRLYQSAREVPFGTETIKKGDILVNGKKIADYFFGKVSQAVYSKPLIATNTLEKYIITIKADGGGNQGQLEAVVHGISRALSKLDPKNRAILKKAGFLTRDPRTRERRKVGMGGKARRKKQSPKR